MAYPTSLLEYFGSLVRPRGEDECWPWHTAKAQRGGYGGISKDRVGALAHRVSYEYYKGAIPEGMIVRHTCDNPPCVNPNHLLVGTYSDNIRDCVERGRYVQARLGGMARFGERHHKSKVTADEVREMRRAYAAKETNLSQLARQYKMSVTAAGYIVNRINWKHVE